MFEKKIWISTLHSYFCRVCINVFKLLYIYIYLSWHWCSLQAFHRGIASEQLLWSSSEFQDPIHGATLITLVGGDWNHGMDYDFPFSWECHNPNWRTPSFFQRGRLNHQPVYCWPYSLVIFLQMPLKSWPKIYAIGTSIGTSNESVPETAIEMTFMFFSRIFNRAGLQWRKLSAAAMGNQSSVPDDGGELRDYGPIISHKWNYDSFN